MAYIIAFVILTAINLKQNTNKKDFLPLVALLITISTLLTIGFINAPGPTMIIASMIALHVTW